MKSLFLSLSAVLALAACGDEIDPVSPVADVLVREELNLNSVAAQPLRFRDGSAVTIPGGVRGIVVYKKSGDQYRAFERFSPHRMQDSCGALVVPPHFFYMEDTCHGCRFDWEGRPVAGPCRSLLKTYRVQFMNEFTLLITNP